MATREALVPFFDHGRVSVADDLSVDVVVPLIEEDSSRFSELKQLQNTEL